MDARESSRLGASSEPPGMMVNPNSYGGLQNNSMVMPSSAGTMPGMRLSFNPMASSMSKPTDSSSSLYHGDGSMGMRPGGVLNVGEQMKKRGRPRKYGPEDSTSLALTPSQEPLPKRIGRPPGSGKKQQLYNLGSAGISFTPHIIIVKAGEDVASKIMAFSQQGPRTVCVLSATGAICNVTLRQPATSGGTVTYEGRYEIISLSGSFLLTENGGTRSRTGGLSVALAGTDGHVLGGGVAGMLMAATPVQVVVGSFIAGGKKPKPGQLKPSSAPPQMTGFGGASASPHSQGTSSKSSGSEDVGSPLNQSAGTCDNSGQHVPNLSAYITSVSWPHSANQRQA